MADIIFYLDHFTPELLYILTALLGIIFSIFILIWLYNRRRFHSLAHQIPAGVVKNYLDSIIQNSSALKSSLFRGGGLDMTEGVPSVIPGHQLGAGDSSVVSSGASSEELNRKNAEIATLRQQLAEKQNQVTDLDRKVSDLEEALQKAPSGGGGASDAEVKSLKEKIADLEAQLKEAQASQGQGGGEANPELEQKLQDVTKERDELKERLQEYEIIEDDLANLKRLQQENEQLKKALEAAGGSVPEAAAEESSAPEPATEASAPAPADEPEAAEEAPAEEAQAAPEESEEKKKDDEGEGKSAEDLLSEFEKMLE